MLGWALDSDGNCFVARCASGVIRWNLPLPKHKLQAGDRFLNQGRCLGHDCGYSYLLHKVFLCRAKCLKTYENILFPR